MEDSSAPKQPAACTLDEITKLPKVTIRTALSNATIGTAISRPAVSGLRRTGFFLGAA